MAVMQQQGIPIPTNLLNNTNGNNHNNALNKNHPTHIQPHSDIAMSDSQSVPVDQNMHQIDQDQP